MTILITGGRGQLGRALQQAFSREEVVAPGHDVLDVTDRGAVSRAMADIRPRIVIHAAAWTDTAACEREPELAIERNGEAAGIVAAACSRANAAMVYVSSNEVFGGDKGAPYDEDDEPNPVNAYGRSKLIGEERVREALGQHWIVRACWLYGPGRVSFPEKILQAAREKGALKAVTNEIAAPTWTLDLAQAIARLVRQPVWTTYHLANSGQASRQEWAEEVLRLAGMDIPVEPATQQEFGLSFRKPVLSTLANNRAAALGVTLRPWQEALADHMRASVSAPVGDRG